MAEVRFRSSGRRVESGGAGLEVGDVDAAAAAAGPALLDLAEVAALNPPLDGGAAEAQVRLVLQAPAPRQSGFAQHPQERRGQLRAESLRHPLGVLLNEFAKLYAAHHDQVLAELRAAGLESEYGFRFFHGCFRFGKE